MALRAARLPLVVVALILGLGPSAGVSAGSGRDHTVRPAAVYTEASVTSSLLAVKTSTHRKVYLQVTDDRGNDTDPPASLDLIVSTLKLAYRQPGESDNWSFSPPAKTVHYSESNGTLSLTTGNAIKPYGRAAMSFKPAKRVTVACDSGSREQFIGTLSGTLRFTTKTKAYGTIGSNSARFALPKSTLTFDHQCALKRSALKPCESGIGWLHIYFPPATTFMDSQSFEATSFDRPDDKVSTVLHVINSYGLASPPDAYRYDEITTASLTQNYDAGTHTIISNGTGGAVTGLVTVQSDGTTGNPTQYTCVHKGSKMSENIQLQTNTTYTNGAPPLTAHFLTDGALKLPNGGVATTSVLSVWSFS